MRHPLLPSPNYKLLQKVPAGSGLGLLPEPRAPSIAARLHPAAFPQPATVPSKNISVSLRRKGTRPCIVLSRRISMQLIGRQRWHACLHLALHGQSLFALLTEGMILLHAGRSQPEDILP